MCKLTKKKMLFKGEIFFIPLYVADVCVLFQTVWKITPTTICTNYILNELNFLITHKSQGMRTPDFHLHHHQQQDERT